MKIYKRFLCMVLVLLSFCLLSNSLTFAKSTDYDDNETILNYLKERFIIYNKDNEDTLSVFITRGEMARYLIDTGYFACNTYYLNPFQDSIENTNYDRKKNLYPMMALYALDIYCGDVNEKGQRLANEDVYLTREQAAVFLTRAFSLKSAKTIETPFQDYENVSEYAKEAVAICYANDIIAGNADGIFEPQENITKLEFLKTLYKIIITLPDPAYPLFKNDKSRFDIDEASENIKLRIQNQPSLTMPIELELENKSDTNRYLLGEMYQLEKERNGEWYRIGFTIDTWDATGLIIGPKDVYTFKVNLSDRIKGLTKGRYRMIYLLRNQEIGVKDEFCYVEFEIL